MPVVIPPGFAEIAIQFSNVGDPDPWYITFGMDVSGFGGDITQVGELALTSMDPWKQVISNTCTIPGAFVTMGQDGPDNIRQFVPPLVPYQGQNQGAKLPQNCALLVRKNTAVGGRRARGRFFLPGILNDGGVDNVGRIDGNERGTFQAAADLMLAALFSTPGSPESSMVVLHGTEGTSSIIDPTPVTSLTVDPVISTQRRRLR